jgi:hypothetical protein
MFDSILSPRLLWTLSLTAITGLSLAATWLMATSPLCGLILLLACAPWTALAALASDDYSQALST